MNCNTYFLTTIVLLFRYHLIHVEAVTCRCTTNWLGAGCYSCNAGCYHTEISWGTDKCTECPTGRYQPSSDSTSSSCTSWGQCYAPTQYISIEGTQTSNRVCATCPQGKQSTGNNQPSCEIDIDACANGGTNLCRAAGDTGASCLDNTAPSLSYSCSCTSGYHEQGGECVDIQSCTTNTCKTYDSNAQCIDKASPDVGYDCDCSSGYTFVGSDCMDVDECAQDTCNDFGDIGSTCTDNHPPATGVTCTCTDGYEQKEVNGVVSCHDVDSCVGNACSSNGDTSATCFDAAPPALTYTCGCTVGYSYDSSSGACIDTNSCEDNPCAISGDNDAQCIDSAPGSQTEYTCTCSSGFEGNATCVDIDGCSGDPCNAGPDTTAQCFDRPAPDVGYSCTCSSDVFSFDGIKCVDNDFCLSDEPCKADGDMNATCVDGHWNSSITHTCGNCSVGFELSSDLQKCSKVVKSSESPINFNDGSGQAVVGGAVLILLLLVLIVCWYRRRAKKSIEKSEKVLKRAQVELSSTDVTRDFDAMELGGDMICDLDVTGTSADVDALEKAKKKLEQENAALRRDNQKHKQKLEKHSLSRIDNEDVKTLSSKAKPVAFGSEKEMWNDDDL